MPGIAEATGQTRALQQQREQAIKSELIENTKHELIYDQTTENVGSNQVQSQFAFHNFNLKNRPQSGKVRPL